MRTLKLMRFTMDFKIIRQQFSSRGGGIEIDLTPFGFKGHKMAAFQNYLGGGMLGSIGVNDTIRSQESDVKLQLTWSNRFNELDKIGEALMRHFHEQTNHSDDEWEGCTFEENQKREHKAY